MKVSVIISVYQSHGVMERQMMHFFAMPLPQDVEIIIVDDGSDPPYQYGDFSEPLVSCAIPPDYPDPNFRILYTNNTLAWTQGLGRNMGAADAKGEYLLMTDADHILSREAIEAVRAFDGDRMMFPRYFGVLLEDGALSQDLDTLREYGLDVGNLGKRGLYASWHQNTFAIKKTTFDMLGGYEPKHSLVGYHPITKAGDDVYFNKKWNRWATGQGIRVAAGPPIYVWPIGKFHIRGETNPMGLFHNLSYDGKKVMHKGEEDA
jgi:hypothetical protein